MVATLVQMIRMQLHKEISMECGNHRSLIALSWTLDTY